MIDNTRRSDQPINLEILDLSFHRNGIGGIPFYAALFHDGNSLKIGIVFTTEAHCAVLDLELLLEADIAFGSNSWCGDQYEPLLRDFISDRFRTK